MLKQLIWNNGRPTKFACLYAATCAFGAFAGYVDGPQIAADAQKVYEARLAAEEVRRMAPPPIRQPSACELDPSSSIWCGMVRFYIPN